MKIRESAENYLEAILIESRNKDRVRAIDICTHLGFSRPTVSVMLKNLREKGLVEIDENSSLFLTEQGLQIACATYERHCVIAELLIKIGVSPETARKDACKLEHDLSEESFACLKKHLASLT
ncbi:MAG: metal-dependent transcriptional regulator [Clostridia bacterium]|nr:metal-dependent transcriptional regulator [Clostridia bacterium]